MMYTKKEERCENLLMVYFVDHLNRKQGILRCYEPNGKLPMPDNLLYTELYKDDKLVSKELMVKDFSAIK